MTIEQTLRDALKRAWNLGQTYWQQADSDSYAENRRSDETRNKFQALMEDTIAQMAAPTAAAVPDDMVLARCRRTLEIIAVGDSTDPRADADQALQDIGFWSAAQAAKPEPAQRLDGDALRRIWVASGEPGNFSGDFLPLARRIESAVRAQIKEQP